MSSKINKTPAQPNPSARIGFPVFESIGQASAAIGAPEALLKAAKRQGCKAFIASNRVDTGLLLPFLFKMLTTASQIPEGFASWKDFREMQLALTAEVARKKAQGVVMDSADAQQQAATAWAFVMSELERAERELPPDLAGCTAVDAFKRLHAFTEQLRRTAKQKFEEIGQ